MEQKEKKILFLSNLFQHLDGIVLIPTIIELQKYKILDYIKNQKKCSLSELTIKYNANPGYLNVALRLLCSQGILIQEIINEEVFFMDSMLTEWFSSKIHSKYKIFEHLYTHDMQYNCIITDSKEDEISSMILFSVLENYIKFRSVNAINPDNYHETIITSIPLIKFMENHSIFKVV